MAHKIRVIPVPHQNKDGTLSKSKVDYKVIDKTRGKTIEVGVASSKNAVADMIADYRIQEALRHAKEHPNDHRPKKE